MKNSVRFFFSFLAAAVIMGAIAGSYYGIALLEEKYYEKHYEETPSFVQIETEQIDENNYRDEGEFHGYIGEKYFYVQEIMASSDVLEIPATLYDKPIFFTGSAFSSYYCDEDYSGERDNQIKIKVAESNNDYLVENDALYTKDKKKLIFYFGKATTFDFPEELEEIGDFAFAASSIESADIPDSVSAIGEGAFERAALCSVELPSSLTKIEKNTFNNCKLTEIVFPDFLDTIESDAFSFSKIDELILPDTALNIESEAFSSCSIKHLVLPANLKYIGFGAFDGCYDSLEQLDINCSSGKLSDSSIGDCGLFDAGLFTGYDEIETQGEKLVINSSDAMYPCNFTKILLYYKEVEINMPSKPKNYKADMNYSFIKRNVECTFEGNTVKMLNKKTGNETIVKLNFKN